MIGLVRFFAAEIARTGLGASVVLAIEEPELSQHRSQERGKKDFVNELAARECPSEPTGQLAEIIELARKL